MYEDYCKLWDALQKDIDTAMRDSNDFRKFFFFKEVLPRLLENVKGDMFSLGVTKD